MEVGLDDDACGDFGVADIMGDRRQTRTRYQTCGTRRPRYPFPWLNSIPGFITLVSRWLSRRSCSALLLMALGRLCRSLPALSSYTLLLEFALLVSGQRTITKGLSIINAPGPGKYVLSTPSSSCCPQHKDLRLLWL